MPPYLIRRLATYYYRRVVPVALRPYLVTQNGKPRAEFVFSLKTTDLSEAKRLALREAIRVDAELEAAERQRQAGAPPRRQGLSGPLESPAETLRRESYERDQRESDAWRNETDAEDEEFLARFNKQYEQFTGDERIEFRNLDPAIHERAGRISARQRAYNAAGAAISLRVEEFGVEGAFKPHYPGLMKTFDTYSVAASVSPATVKRWRPVIQHLIDYLGHDNAQRITFENLKGWRDTLLTDRLPNGKTLTVKTIRDSYVAAVRATLRFATEEGLISENPSTDLKVRSQKVMPKLRGKHFTPQEASTILTAALSALTDPANSKLSSEMRLARRWIPWLCAYTGARVNELTQLRECDIKKDGDVWYLHITPEAGSVKTGEAREVPLHSHLIEQGVTALAQRGSLKPIFYDPARGRNGSAANPHSKKVGEYLARWVRELGVTDVGVQPNHGWRHTFKTLARRHGLLTEAVSQILGHAAENVGESYGSWEIDVLAREIEKFARFKT